MRDLWEPPETATAEQRIQRYMTGTRIGDADLRIVELTGQAGDAFVMHCDTLHAPASSNRRDEPRMMATNIVLV